VLNSYLKFEVTGVSGSANAVLRLHAETNNAAGGTIVAISNTWAESTITAGNAPAAGVTLATIPAITAGAPVDINLGQFINGSGTYSIALLNGNGNLSRFTSREGASPPQLIITP
jgi:hypothetical protein